MTTLKYTKNDKDNETTKKVNLSINFPNIVKHRK